MFRNRSLILLVALLGHQAAADDDLTTTTTLAERSARVTVIPHGAQSGSLFPFPQYPEERIVSGTSDVSVHHLFSGQLEVVSTRIRPVKVTHHEPFPIDEVLVVLEGELHTHLEGEDEPRVFKPGDMVWVPAGTMVTVEEFVAGDSGYYRSLVVTPPAEDFVDRE